MRQLFIQAMQSLDSEPETDPGLIAVEIPKVQGSGRGRGGDLFVDPLEQVLVMHFPRFAL